MNFVCLWYQMKYAIVHRENMRLSESISSICIPPADLSNSFWIDKIESTCESVEIIDFIVSSCQQRNYNESKNIQLIAFFICFRRTKIILSMMQLQLLKVFNQKVIRYHRQML